MATIVLDITPRVKQWKDLRNFLETATKNTPASVSIAVYETVGTDTFNESQKMVPHDTGALKSTGLLEPPNKSNGYTTTVSYGRVKPKVPTSRGEDSVIYAQAVHERDVNYTHGVYRYLQEAAVNAVNKTSGGKMAALVLEIYKDRARRNPQHLKPITGSAAKS